jgi:spermidine/putrescine-binding protein
MKGRLLTIAALALIMTFGFASSELQAAESVSAYLGFSREVNEALSQRIQEKTGIEVKGITLSWGEIWARLVSEAPRFNADMVLSFGAAQAIDGTKKGFYIPYKSPTWEDIDVAFKSSDGSYYARGLSHLY